MEPLPVDAEVDLERTFQRVQLFPEGLLAPAQPPAQPLERLLVQLAPAVEVQDPLELRRHRVKLVVQELRVLDGDATPLGQRSALEAPDEVRDPVLTEQFLFQDPDRESLDGVPGDVAVRAGGATTF